MIIEVSRFVGYVDGDIIFGNREHMKFEPMTINTEYVAWVKREMVSKVEMCAVSFVDRGLTFTIDKTYEEMRDLLRGEKTTQETSPIEKD